MFDIREHGGNFGGKSAFSPLALVTAPEIVNTSGSPMFVYDFNEDTGDIVYITSTSSYGYQYRNLKGKVTTIGNTSNNKTIGANFSGYFTYDSTTFLLSHYTWGGVLVSSVTIPSAQRPTGSPMVSCFTAQKIGDYWYCLNRIYNPMGYVLDNTGKLIKTFSGNGDNIYSYPTIMRTKNDKALYSSFYYYSGSDSINRVVFSLVDMKDGVVTEKSIYLFQTLFLVIREFMNMYYKK